MQGLVWDVQTLGRSCSKWSIYKFWFKFWNHFCHGGITLVAPTGCSIRYLSIQLFVIKQTQKASPWNNQINQFVRVVFFEQLQKWLVGTPKKKYQVKFDEPTSWQPRPNCQGTHWTSGSCQATSGFQGKHLGTSYYLSEQNTSLVGGWPTPLKNI